MITRSKKEIYKPKALSIDLLNTKTVFVAQALACPHWKAIMEEEFKALIGN